MGKVKFNGESLELQKTDHAIARMRARKITDAQLVEVIENGMVKMKQDVNRFWVFKFIEGRADNLISASVVIERPKLVVVTVMINWSPA